MHEKELVDRLLASRGNGDPKKYLAMITVDEAHRAAALIKRLSSVPDNARERMYFPIVMPLNADGQGPASEEAGEIRKLTWEVWDQFCYTFGSFPCLPDAIMEAERLNREHYAALASQVQP